MPWRFTFILLFLFFTLLPDGNAQQNSVLAQGQWFKLGVTHSGVYKLPASFLKSKGIASDATDPRYLQIWGYGGGMLPEANAQPRPQDLPQLAIHVSGESDGKLDAGDYVLFYAEGPDALRYNPETGWFQHQKNLYSDTAYYFISIGSQQGLRLSQEPNQGLHHPKINTYEAVEVHEKDEVNIISSGRRWFGEGFGSTTSRQYHTGLQELKEGNIKLRTAFINTNKAPVTFKVSLNGQQMQELPIRKVDDGQYAPKGWIVEQESQLSTSAISPSPDLQLQISLTGANSSNAAYLDYFLLQAPVHLRYRGKQLQFLSPKSLQQPVSTYQLADAPEGLLVWDISNPQEPKLQETVGQNGQLAFGSLSLELRNFMAFTAASAPEPHFFGEIPPQNLHADLQAELLILTHPLLLAEAERLADFRRSHDGLQVKVVPVQQVYNEFSSGRQDIVAIRDYVRYLHTQGGGKLKYLLLFGRGYYDYKYRTPLSFNLVPLYESYNSVHPIYSYASDDFYGFLEESEGVWTENEAGNQSLEIGIGRIPVATATEAKGVVDKLIRYSTHSATLGNWRQRICFVADDEDANVHQNDAEGLAAIIEAKQKLYNIRKIYVDAYPKVLTPNSQTSPGTQAALQDALQQGALMVNFTGHGSYRYWTFENIFSKTAAEKLQNRDRLPLFITATCDFGLHDGQQRSGAESLLLNPKGGAIGLLTTARPVFSFTNYKINSAFYNNAFPETPDQTLRLGDIMRLTKNEGVPRTGVNNRNFVLLGDPSMQLAYPKQQAQITSITGSNGTSTDTLKAFDRVQVQGVISGASEQVDASFNGKLLATVYDKADVLHTLGQSDPSISYRLRQNVLFRGEARVINGQFQFEMPVPKNIRYDMGFGRIELYAVHNNGKIDAAGASESVKVGSSTTPVQLDNTPPQITLYLNDTTFRSGSPVATQAVLLARLWDENGINISFAGLGQNIEARLNDSITFILNDYYSSTKGNYKEGWLRFPLNNLSPGLHKLELQAWDTRGNARQAHIRFVVPGSKGIIISEAYNYPNPVKLQTTFAITHNRAGDDLEVNIAVYAVNGNLVQHIRQEISNANSTVSLPSILASGKNLLPGLYLFKVMLRSLTDGSAAERTEKLVILK